MFIVSGSGSGTGISVTDGYGSGTMVNVGNGQGSGNNVVVGDGHVSGLDIAGDNGELSGTDLTAGHGEGSGSRPRPRGGHVLRAHAHTQALLHCFGRSSVLLALLFWLCTQQCMGPCWRADKDAGPGVRLAPTCRPGLLIPVCVCGCRFGCVCSKRHRIRQRRVRGLGLWRGHRLPRWRLGISDRRLCSSPRSAEERVCNILVQSTRWLYGAAP